MSQRTKLLTQIAGFCGWKIQHTYWESLTGVRLEPTAGYVIAVEAVLVLVMVRRWAPRCGQCFAIVPRKCHEQRPARRWLDLPWAGHRVVIEYAAIRLKCPRCGGHATELLAWADAGQRQTRRLQQHLALDASSAPISHVAAKYGLSWRTVARAEAAALLRWEKTRLEKPLYRVGVDEKWLGRRHKRNEKFVTIVSDLDTGEPVWIGYGRSAETLTQWLCTLSAEQKSQIVVFACDMHRPYLNAIRSDPALDHAALSHDPFHVMKRAGEALTELRRETFFRAGGPMRAVGRGARWLVLRPWERLADKDKDRLRHLLRLNARLARAYQTVEQLREALKAPDEVALGHALWVVLRRTAKRSNIPMRKLHDSLLRHLPGILALGEHRPPVGRIEALNGNWETLVRQGRGYRNHAYLLAKLRFLTINPVRTRRGVLRFLALGLTPPVAEAA